MDPKMVKTIDKERVLGKIKKEKSAPKLLKILMSLPEPKLMNDSDGYL